ncbi:DUF1549 domain-containing protein [Urbifossiella limnaea]|uniref:Bacterial Ig-like domain (Group 2) n=1 Tax=Urbifossiella limnaea TaxID=2528023 RepID=A0A517XQ92_9BACT|nr:DUF1549 domain-containing protein [Urbifossiella limnaea]QDU19662.1 Bacterial Ig-like domain (group 2) [Urbifossiella limnaea]
MRWFAVAFVVGAVTPSVRAEPAPSFLNEVVPILTRSGCNQGGCHGKGNGQNGFRLSLRGYAPEQDHRYLTREFDGRRIDPAKPEASLLLQKAVGAVPHEGGRLFGVGSREYATLLAWVKAGAPGPNKSDPALSRLSITPNSKVVKPGDTTPLVATATFADGSKKDVTWLTKFDANDAGTVSVSPTGEAKAVRAGSAAVRAMFQTDVAVAVFTIPHDRPVDDTRFKARNNLVDDHVFARLRELRIEPSDDCTDAEYVRRAFLDSCGLLPTPAEVTAFLADRDPKKREKLVDSLLSRPEFSDYWALQLGDIFQNRKERDHDVRGVKGVRSFHLWLREQVAANRPWDELARDVLTASGGVTSNPAVGYFIVTVGEQRHGEKSEAPESVAQALLGTRIGCARCHNHPLERFTQDDFYHFAAYFSRVSLDRREARWGLTTLLISHPDQNQNKNPVGVTQPRTGQFMKARPLDRTAADAAPTDDPRQALAKWVTDAKNEAFAGAMVNRVWRHYLGVGLVEPVDDLRATNPPTNPLLWAALKAEFVAKKYDLRALMRLILTSRAYQLSAATRAGNATDDRYYSHYYARRLPAEVLLDAITDVTGVPERFDGYPLGTRAVQVPDPGTASDFLRMFGRSDRVTACACERSGDVTLPAVLHILGGSTTVGKVQNASGWLARSLAAEKDDAKLLDAVFLRTLGRLPAADERGVISAHRAGAADRAAFYQDVFWALLNSKEFLFNR